MKISPIITGVNFRSNSGENKRRFTLNKHNMVSTTGYISLGFGIASGVLGYKKKLKSHKITAIISLAAAAVHVGLIEARHLTYKKQTKLM